MRPRGCGREDVEMEVGLRIEGASSAARQSLRDRAGEYRRYPRHHHHLHHRGSLPVLCVLAGRRGNGVSPSTRAYQQTNTRIASCFDQR